MGGPTTPKHSATHNLPFDDKVRVLRSFDFNLLPNTFYKEQANSKANTVDGKPQEDYIQVTEPTLKSSYYG